MEWPAAIADQPVERDGFVATELSREFQEHWTNEGHFSVDWGTAEDVTSAKGERNVLDHFGEEFEIVDVAHEVERIVDGA